jgi:hypothetical protein
VLTTLLSVFLGANSRGNRRLPSEYREGRS